jgi:hypothetical protein
MVQRLSEADSHVIRKFPAFYGARKFIALFTRARHCALSRERRIQSTPLDPFSSRSILMPSSKPRIVVVPSLQTSRLKFGTHLSHLHPSLSPNSQQKPPVS